MDEAAELGNYLPLSFKRPKDLRYIKFLLDAVETNYTHGNYQVAVLVYPTRQLPWLTAIF